MNIQHETNASADIACTLDASDFGARIAEWRDLARLATERRVERGRITTVYPGGADVHARLLRLVEAETACCPFLAFDIRNEGESIRVDLTFPPEAEAMVDQVVGAS